MPVVSSQISFFEKTKPLHITRHGLCFHPAMACPECHQPCARIHGRYRRTVADLPCAGRNVMLALTVRKFVCGAQTCPGKSFTERVPG
jgi:transposase